MTLEATRIKSLPDDAYYIPNFITEDEEERLLQKVGGVDYFLFCRLILCGFLFEKGVYQS